MATRCSPFADLRKRAYVHSFTWTGSRTLFLAALASRMGGKKKEEDVAGFLLPDSLRKLLRDATISLDIFAEQIGSRKEMYALEQFMYKRLVKLNFLKPLNAAELLSLLENLALRYLLQSRLYDV
ncbi:hypothetical protein EAG_07103 [Camponotus floridanus]|uniref:Uncharacterized protein n=1 Tax=Camponotus floridanus TaxID=104421 RepID=E2A8D6_CAMFO|nr:hypothetical protein EAG_07103 [Camponotus floridanus]